MKQHPQTRRNPPPNRHRATGLPPAARLAFCALTALLVAACVAPLKGTRMGCAAEKKDMLEERETELLGASEELSKRQREIRQKLYSFYKKETGQHFFIPERDFFLARAPEEREELTKMYELDSKWRKAGEAYKKRCGLDLASY